MVKTKCYPIYNTRIDAKHILAKGTEWNCYRETQNRISMAVGKLL